MRTPFFSACFLLAALPVLAPRVVEAQERSAGVYAGVEALASSRFLLLKDGSRYEIPSAVWKKYRSAIGDLEKDESFEFFHKNGKLLSIVVETEGRDTGPDQRTRSTGSFVRQRPEGSQVWLVLESGREEAIAPALFRDREKARVLNSLRPGSRIIYWTKGGYVIDIKPGSISSHKVDPAVAKILAKSTRGDLVHVQLKQENSPKFYRIKTIQAHRLFLQPHVPHTDNPPRFKGTVVFNLKDIALIINREARKRAASSGGDPGEGGVGNAESQGVWDRIKVGDMIGIGFKRGQLIHLTSTHYTWRMWSRGFWGEEEEGERKAVQKIREGVDLPKQEIVPLEGGRLEIRVNRSRSARRGGLKFKLELVHNVKPVILVNLKVRFLLGGLTMEPDDPVQSSETFTINHPMFANQREAILHEIRDENFFDGRVEVAVYPKNVVPIKSKEARAHILKAIARTKKPAELRSIYEAAGTNGDRKVCSLLLSRYLLSRDEDHRRVLLKGLQAFGLTAPNLILSEIVGLDRHLEITRLVGDVLVESPLPQGVRPVVYKRKQVDLLPKLTGALSGRLGQQLFDVYNEREDLRDRIEEAFKSRPRDAVTSLLGIATQVDVTASDANEARLRAEGAAKLLRNLGKPILPALYAELRKQGIDPSPCEDQFEKSESASDAIKLGQNMLIQQYLRLQEEEWSRLIEKAEGLAATNKDWDGALALVRGILLKKKDHEEARDLLPALLVSKGIAQREEGNRGDAAVAFEEALPLLNVGERSKATGPLAELLVQSASEDVEQVSLRTHPHPAAGLVRAAKLQEIFEAQEARSRWLQVKVGDGVAYVLTSCTRPAGENKVAISSAATPFKDVNEMLERAKEFSKATEPTANEIYGRLSAREGKLRYDNGQFQAAMHHFDEAAKYAPTDPRLELRFKCLLEANTGPLVAAGLVLAFAIGIGLMQAFSRPKKIAFKGEFKHYGAERSAHERDLDLPDAGGE